MNAALRDYRAIWRAASAQCEPRALRGVYLVAGAIAACGVIVALLGDLRPLQALRFTIGTVFMALAFAWTFLFVPGSIRLNSPVNAWLLPRQRRRLLQMSGLYLGVATLGIAYGLGNWNVLPIVAVGTLGMTLIIAGNKYIAYLMMLAGSAPWLAHVAVPPAWTERVTGDTAILVMDLLIVPAVALSLRWMYPAGGDVFLARRDDQIRRVNHFAFRSGEKDPNPDVTAWQGNLSLYRVALRVERLRADPGTMLMHALGPIAHWTAWAGAIVIVLAISIVMHILSGLSHGVAEHPFARGLAGIGPVIMVLLVGLSTVQYGQQFRRTQGEQALLRLTPLAGDATLLNRRLAARMLRQALAIWALLTAVLMGASFMFGSGPDGVLRQLGLCSLAGQVAMMGLLGDYAGGRAGWNWALGLRAAAYAAVQALAAVGLGKLTGTTAWPWLIEISLAVCVVKLRLDWKRMLAAPPAFPADRMA